MLVVCVGTGTSVGKTWVGAHILAAVRDAGVTVAARKPAQSFARDDPEPTDADVLAVATAQAVSEVCPAHRSYPVAMAPPMAAGALGSTPPTLADLVAETIWPDPLPQLRWVESAGGVRSPIASDADSVALCRALGPDLVVLVADAGLGTINAVRLSCDALGEHEVVVILNRFDPTDALHAANQRWLADRDGIPIVTHISQLISLLVQRVDSTESPRCTTTTS